MRRRVKSLICEVQKMHMLVISRVMSDSEKIHGSMTRNEK